MSYLPEDFPDWTFTYSVDYSIENVDIPGGAVTMDTVICTIKAERGDIVILSCYPTIEEAWWSLLEKLTNGNDT